MGRKEDKVGQTQAPSEGSDQPAGTIGKVIETRDRRTFVFSVLNETFLRYGDYIQVDFVKEGEDFTLIGQVELIVGEGVKVGQATVSGGISLSMLGIGTEVVQTRDVEKTEVKATARILAFLDSKNAVHSYDPTVGYLGCPVRPAEAQNLSRLFSEIGNPELEPLEVGFLQNARETITVSFDPSGFMRHTAVFGQSGSGKSFSFGIVLEELFLQTDARILAIDPNSDFRQFGRLRPRSEISKHSRRAYSVDQHEKLKQELAKLKDRVIMFSSEQTEGVQSLSLRFGELSEREQVSLLSLDPVTDREEYSVFRETRDAFEDRSYGIQDFVALLSKSPSVEKIRLLYRLQNKGIDRMRIWGEPTILEILREKEWKFAALDVRRSDPLERSIVTASVLNRVYEENTKSRKPTFIVVDEAHNFCPTEPWYDHQKETQRILSEIASEGRKYGVFLILLSQNPSKISEQVLFQCDNVILMRMTSEFEVSSLAAILSNISPELTQSAFALSKGQAICLGGIVRAPTLMQFDLRKTEVGGDDLSKAWARKRFKG